MAMKRNTTPTGGAPLRVLNVGMNLHRHFLLLFFGHIPFVFISHVMTPTALMIQLCP
jgi:hypothetical protein